MSRDWVMVLAVSLLLVAVTAYSLLVAEWGRRRDGKRGAAGGSREGKERPSKAA